jgi:hypothetical protein
MALVEEMGRLDLGSKKNLMNFVKIKIVEGVFPRSFLNQLKDIDRIVD